MSMTSSRPYIIRALYDWIVENECTPYLLLDSDCSGVSVPPKFAEDDQVVLNVSPMAVRELQLENDAVSFMARFDGKSCHVYVPVAGVMAIYARENGQGMVFEVEPSAEEDDILGEEDVKVLEPTPVASLKSIDKPSEEDGVPPPPPPKGKGRPSLKVVK